MAAKTDLGAVLIRNDVIGTIASLAAQEVAGVLGIWKRSFPFGTWIGDRGVRVQTQDHEVRIWIHLIAEYGVSLPDVATHVQDRVREVVERMTQLTAVEVHVGIHHVQRGGSSK